MGGRGCLKPLIWCGNVFYFRAASRCAQCTGCLHLLHRGTCGRMRYRHACGHLSRNSHENVRAINGRQLGAGSGCVKANASCMAARFQRILRLVVRLGLVRTKANTEDPKITVFKREERTPWVKMSVPRHHQNSSLSLPPTICRWSRHTTQPRSILRFSSCRSRHVFCRNAARPRPRASAGRNRRRCLHSRSSPSGRARRVFWPRRYVGGFATGWRIRRILWLSVA